MTELTKEGLGFGIVGRVRGFLEKKGDNGQKTMHAVRDMARGKSDFKAGVIVSSHIDGVRDANRELAPGLKDY